MMSGAYKYHLPQQTVTQQNFYKINLWFPQ